VVAACSGPESSKRNLDEGFGPSPEHPSSFPCKRRVFSSWMGSSPAANGVGEMGETVLLEGESDGGNRGGSDPATDSLAALLAARALAPDGPPLQAAGIECERLRGDARVQDSGGSGAGGGERAGAVCVPAWGGGRGGEKGGGRGERGGARAEEDEGSGGVSRAIEEL